MRQNKNKLPRNVKLRVQMDGITVDVRQDAVNEALALELIDLMMETVEERLEGDASE